MPQAHRLRWGGRTGDCPGWLVVQSGCAWHRVVLGWALRLCLLGAKGQGCDVLRMHQQEGLMDWVRPEEPWQAGEMEAL